MSTRTEQRLTASEAAAYLGKSYQTLAIWRCTKRYPLRYRKNGGTVEYLKSDLDAFLEGRTVHPVEELQGV
jgi:hypothetical protein